jgi:hypothetical protein
LYHPNVSHYANNSVIDTSTNITAIPSQIQQEPSPTYTSCCDDSEAWPGGNRWEMKDGYRPWWTGGYHRINSNVVETYNKTGLLEKRAIAIVSHDGKLLIPV